MAAVIVFALLLLMGLDQINSTKDLKRTTVLNLESPLASLVEFPNEDGSVDHSLTKDTLSRVKRQYYDYYGRDRYYPSPIPIVLPIGGFGFGGPRFGGRGFGGPGFGGRGFGGPGFGGRGFGGIGRGFGGFGGRGIGGGFGGRGIGGGFGGRGGRG